MDLIVMIMLGLIYALIRWAASVYRSIYALPQSTEQRFSFDIFRRRYATIEWGWEEPVEVGSTMSFKIKFYGIAQSPRSISDIQNLKIEITRNHLAIAHVEEPSDRQLDENPLSPNEITVNFTVRASGVYKISINEDGRIVAGGPHKRTFIPGLPIASRTSLIRTLNMSSVLPIIQNKSHILTIEPRDEFGNMCGNRLHSSILRDKFELMVTKIDTSDSCPIPVSTDLRMFKDNVVIDLLVPMAGCFHAVVTYENQEIGNGEFDLIVLTVKDSIEVEENITKRNLNIWYEAHYLSTTSETWLENSDSRSGFARALSMGEMPTTSRASDFRSRRLSALSSSDSKPRKVFIYLTPKQLIIKEFYFLVFPKRLQSFRLCQATKIITLSAERSGKPTVILISDGCQPSMTLSCAKAPVMIATFIEIINKHIGGSDSFDEKVKHFREELLSYHNLSKFGRGKTTLTVGRENILHESYKQTKNFYVKDWCKLFDISFKNEFGIDWGGLTREWISLLCKELFIPPVNETSELQAAQGDAAKLAKNSYFRRLKDDNQALVLPAGCSTSGAKLKMFEFAGKLVGKCLIDGTCGHDQVRYINARFARSFLAQIIGLAVTYKHFESDDPELYKSKIRYIIENDVSDFDLFFSEEVYLPNGKLHQVVSLKHGGTKIRVTNENKCEYLNCLARYRLSTSIKQETDAFLKGLNYLVPDHLLSVFDENELELVLCGSSKISVIDMKQHSVISDSTFLFAKILDWFWVAVSSLTQDELAMLLQFTTGCSQMPPGGFSELSPRFKISYAFYHRNNLPTAHTCFNELCLPSYDSYENLHKYLKLAITEGASGFGMI